MPLFRVQDDERPAYVVAKTFTDALAKWELVIREENDGEIPAPPQGVAYICDDDELIGVDTINAT